MRSSFNEFFNLSNEFDMEVVVSSDSRSGVKVYIPMLMPNITKNEDKYRIRNINGNAASLSEKTINTYYGTTYDYYLCRYSDPFNLDGYRTEYVFQQYGSEGLIMYMYLLYH